MAIFRTVDLEALEKKNPETLIVTRVIARLWQTVDDAEKRGRADKAERAERLARKFKTFKKGSQNAGMVQA